MYDYRAGTHFQDHLIQWFSNCKWWPIHGSWSKFNESQRAVKRKKTIYQRVFIKLWLKLYICDYKIHFFFLWDAVWKTWILPKETLYFWISRTSKYSPSQQKVVHSCHFLIYKGHQKRNSHNLLLILYHTRKDIFNIVKIEQNKRLYVKLITLYLFFLSPYLLEQRTECQR